MNPIMPAYNNLTRRELSSHILPVPMHRYQRDSFALNGSWPQFVFNCIQLYSISLSCGGWYKYSALHKKQLAYRTIISAKSSGAKCCFLSNGSTERRISHLQLLKKRQRRALAARSTSPFTMQASKLSQPLPLWQCASLFNLSFHAGCGTAWWIFAQAALFVRAGDWWATRAPLPPTQFACSRTPAKKIATTANTLCKN